MRCTPFLPHGGVEKKKERSSNTTNRNRESEKEKKEEGEKTHIYILAQRKGGEKRNEVPITSISRQSEEGKKKKKGKGKWGQPLLSIPMANKEEEKTEE